MINDNENEAEGQKQNTQIITRQIDLDPDMDANILNTKCVTV